MTDEITRKLQRSIRSVFAGMGGPAAAAARQAEAAAGAEAAPAEGARESPPLPLRPPAVGL